jgi:AraC-like DNA-binding protein
VTWYEPVAAPENLRGVVACTWTARPNGVHRLVPDACIDVVCLGSGEMLVCGPETQSWTFSLPPNTVAVGIRFLPGGLRALFGTDIGTIRNQRVRAGQIFGPDFERRTRSALADSFSHGDLDRARQELEAAFIDDKPTTDPFATDVTARLARDPSIAAADLAAALHCNTRQLHRHSCLHFGFGVATLARILRFHRFTECAARAPSHSIAALAAESGYHDESHLARDCRSIAGTAPRAFLDEWFPTFAPDRPLLDLVGTSHKSR